MSGKKQRALAFTGKGYGSLRYRLFRSAKEHVKQAVAGGYYCEAIAVIESMITDRLESRVGFLSGRDVNFSSLGPILTRCRQLETDRELLTLVGELDAWRKARNGAIHELVKVEVGAPLEEWSERLAGLRSTAESGLELCARLYERVAVLNPLHTDPKF